MSAERLRLHDRMAVSRANGPGRRAVLWFQGCDLGCSGCFNPETHPASGGTLHRVAEILDWLMALGDAIEGVSLSGGEPLQQPRAVAELLASLRGTPLSTILFTGYEWREIPRIGRGTKILRSVDVVISGRYEPRRRRATGLLGSGNQEIHFLSDRYAPPDFEEVPTTELIIDPEGGIVRTGIDPPRADLGG